MQILRKKLIPESSVLRAVLIFVFGFVASVILWIPLKDSYSYMITLVASKFLAVIKGATLEEVSQNGDAFSITLGFLTASNYVSAVVNLSAGVSRYYAFTVPLTVSLLAALSLFIKRRERAYAEALLLLLLSHFLYVFFTEATTLTEKLMLNGIEPVNSMRLSFYQYFWKVTEFTAMSFGPFLITIYVWIRFRRR
jgi:hypothetical protein